MILSGRIVEAEEAERIGLADRGRARRARTWSGRWRSPRRSRSFPQQTMLADRSAALEGIGLTLEEGMRLEARAALPTRETAWAGASRFAAGEGRGGAGAGV